MGIQGERSHLITGEVAKKHRARLVTRGFQQKEGIDYNETYATLVKFTTLRIFFAIVANLDLHCHQMDVKTAFLNGDLDQDVFMEQPEGCVDPDKPDFVCKLQKALYGLKQAPRQWYAKLTASYRSLCTSKARRTILAFTFTTKTGRKL